MSNQDEQDDESFAEARLIEAIENQLAAGEPPAALATMNKLTLVGYAREDILELMAQVLAHSINQMLSRTLPLILPPTSRPCAICRPCPMELTRAECSHCVTG